MRKLKIIGGLIVILLAAGYLIVTIVPKPMSSDLSLAGQGEPSIVLAYENFSPTGGDALTRLKQIRPDYESRLNFIVADIGTPDGRGFANRFQLVDGQAVILADNGRPLGRLFVPANEEQLRAYIDSKLIAVEK